MSDLIVKSYSRLFPPQNFPFECFISESQSRTKKSSSQPSNNASSNSEDLIEYTDVDVLLFIPDRIIYDFSIAVLAIGLVLSIIIIIHGLLHIALENTKYFRILNIALGRSRIKDDKSYVKRLRKTLEETHVKWENVLNQKDIIDFIQNNNYDQELDISDYESGSFMKSERLRRRRSAKSNVSEDDDYDDDDDDESFKNSIRSKRNRSIQRIQKQKSGKLESVDRDYYTTRIQYKSPSMLQMQSRQGSLLSLSSSANVNQRKLSSTSSHNSDNENEKVSNKTSKKPDHLKFSLGAYHHNTSDDDDSFSVPEAIKEEEDEKSNSHLKV
jgi:hypothetical protein